MQSIDLNEISIFIKVVQTNSFTQAAKQLAMPISTVSARVSSLEKRLGVTLLQRTTRQLKLTQAGQIYFEQCLKGIEEIYQAESGVITNQSEPTGDLKITAPTFLGSSLLPQIISESLRKFPKINIELILQDRPMDLISEGIDLAIRAGDLKDSTLIAKKIGDVHFAPFASPSYLKTNGNPTHPKDLRSHTCLQFTPMGRQDWPFSNGKSRISVQLSGRILIDELSIIKSLALAGNGIALLPTYICKTESKREKLVQVLPEWKSISRPIHFVYPPQRFPSPKLKSFLEIATESIRAQLQVEK